jgi:GlpG protein
MRLLERFSDPNQAQALSDALEVAGIENDLRPASDGHAVWVIDDTSMEEAAEIARECAVSSEGRDPEGLRVRAEEIRALRDERSMPVRVAATPGTSAVGSAPAGQLTLGLILVCVAVAILSELGDLHSGIVRALLVVPISPDGFYSPGVDWSEPWRVLTPMFIHFGLLHLVFNMLWLYRLGNQIESLQGVVGLAALVVWTQVPGAVVQLELSGPLFGGMSGVVYGLFGYTWMQARYASGGYSLSDQDTLWIMGWFVLCATGLVGHIANAQHAIGLVSGLAAGMPAYLAFRRSSARLTFEEGSWADLNIRGFDRFRRLYFEPYVPLWFMGLAAAVLWLG